MAQANFNYNAPPPRRHTPRPGISQEILIGEAGTSLVLSKLLAWRIPSQEAMPGMAYDVIADVEGTGLLRIQVKTTTRVRNGKLRYRMQRGFYYSRHGNFDYEVTDFDIAACVYLPAGKVCFCPAPVRRLTILPEWLNPAEAEYQTWLLALKHHHRRSAVVTPHLQFPGGASVVPLSDSAPEESSAVPPLACPGFASGRAVQ